MALIGRCRLFRKVKYVRFTIDDNPQPPLRQRHLAKGGEQKREFVTAPTYLLYYQLPLGR